MGDKPLTDDPNDHPTGLNGLTSLFPPPPAHESRVTSESGMSTPVASPQYQSAINDVGATQAAQAGVLEQKGALDSSVATSIQRQAAEQLAAFDKAREAKAAEETRQTAKIKQQADVLKQANDELKNTPSPALFHKGDTWANVAKAVALAVGSFGDALSARGAALQGRSSNQNSVGDIIGMAIANEKEHIAKLKDNQLIAQTGVKDAMAAREMALARIDLAGAEAAKRAQLLGDYMVKAAGPQAAIYQAKLDALGLKAEADKFRASSLASLNKTATSRTTKEETNRDGGATKPTEGGGAIVRDAKGEPIGLAPSVRNVGNIADDDAALSRGIDALKALRADIDENGDRVITPGDVKRRNSLYANAHIGVGANSALGKSDKSLDVEGESIGTSGAGANAIMGANKEAVDHKIKELEDQQQRLRRQKLSPLPGTTEINSKAPDEPAKGGAKHWTPGVPHKIGNVVYVEKSPNNWQPQ